MKYITILSVFFIIGCSSNKKENQEMETKSENTVYIPISMLRVHKIKIDSIEYIIVKDFGSGGVAITKHSK
jgi:hypothetical protein